MRRLLLIFASVIIGTAASAQVQPSLRTVVIDAGHGGHDPGAVSRDGVTYEKNINLDIASTLAELIREWDPELNVILTRSTDVYLTLDERAEKANKAKADLFISVHVNACKKNNINGFSLHILGQSSEKDRDLFAFNMDVCSRENSVIMLEDDYNAKYAGFNPLDPESFIFIQLMQNAYLEQSLRFAQIAEKYMKTGPIKAARGIWQNPFYVLWKTSMPAVLVEVGFISNDEDLGKLRQDEVRGEIAASLLEAFKEYKSIYDYTVGTKPLEDAPAPGNDANGRSAAASGKLYGMQIFSSSRLIPAGSPEFKGLEAGAYRVGEIFKYVVNVSPDRNKVLETKSDVKAKFPSAFLVVVEGEKISQ